MLEERGVIALRQLNLTDQQQVAFTKTLGTIVDEGVNNIYKITMDPGENSQAEYLRGAFYWHIDGTMSDIPILASIMSARRLAPLGGETEFSNTYAAYAELSALEKESLDNLKVVHSFEATQRVRQWPHDAQNKTSRRRAVRITTPFPSAAVSLRASSRSSQRV